MKNTLKQNTFLSNTKESFTTPHLLHFTVIRAADYCRANLDMQPLKKLI